jgi:2-polyprenyl-6-hydroxyphenyl methylase/3-demethylubiquinone-9 3-methyltransferase
MNATEQQKGYYERYWIDQGSGHSGDNQGYAANFRNWMSDELGDLPRNISILEVGCGDGAFTKNLAEYSSDVTAIDISAEQIEQNSRAYPDVYFRQHDVAKPLPFDDETFDVIWCSEVLEHLFDPAFALREMHRVMTPGGLLLVTVPYHGLLKNVLIALFKWDEHFTPNNPHIRFFTKNTLRQITAAAGFEYVRMSTCGMNKPARDLFIATNILLKARKCEPADC